eukprot:2147299-Rhodomonas_salina.3
MKVRSLPIRRGGRSLKTICKRICLALRTARRSILGSTHGWLGPTRPCTSLQQTSAWSTLLSRMRTCQTSDVRIGAAVLRALRRVAQPGKPSMQSDTFHTSQPCAFASTCAAVPPSTELHRSSPCSCSISAGDSRKRRPGALQLRVRSLKCRC